MGLIFNADEIFEMAEQIERNGAKFYREAAKNASSDDIKQMLLDMAVMEDEHLETFEQMREQLTGRETGATVFDPDNEAALYLQTMADSHGSEGMKSPAMKLTGRESTKQVLEAAIGAERDSVLFYVGLKDLVPANAGKDKVEAVIKEEISHIATISRKLKELK
ncbi:MAG: ferritin family protein [Phycisphaerales bacterium]|nr:MAG: ferritin family protein [Phycisphaerales bacterium]